MSFRNATSLGILVLSSLFLVSFSNADSTRLRCGVVAAQTGPLSEVGTSIKNAIILAAQQNPFGKLVEFKFEDDQFLAKNTVSAVRKFMQVDKVKCLVVFGSTTSLAVADIAEQSKIPLLAIALTPKVVEGRYYVLRVYLPVERQSTALVSEIKRRGYSSIAVVTTIQDAMLALREAFLASKAASITFDEQVNPDDRDFNTLGTKILKGKPSAVFVNVLPPQISILSKQLRNLGYKGELFSGPPVGNPAEIKASDGALQNSWFVGLNDEGGSSFYTAYQKAFGIHPPLESLYGYEAANIIINNAKGGGLPEKLRSLKNYSGILGTFAVNNNMLDFPAGIWEVNGQYFNLLRSTNP